MASAQSKWHRVGWLRGGSFLVALGFLLCGLFQVSGIIRPWYWLAGGTFVGFLVVAFFHEMMGDTIRVCRQRVQLYRDAIARLERRLKDVRVWPADPPVEATDVSRDLDLFGAHSLHTLLASVHTPEGIGNLARWIGIPATPAEISGRQVAARSLAGELEWREEFELHVRGLAAGRASRHDRDRSAKTVASGLVEWCRSPNWLGRRAWVLWLARVASVCVLVGVPVVIFGLVPLVIAGPVILGAVALNFFLSVFFSGAIHDEFNQVSSSHREVAVYSRLFEMIDHCQASGGRLDDLRAQLFSSQDDVRLEIRRLGTLAGAASLRSNGIWFLLWMVLQFAFFYDVHVLVFLERWKSRHGNQAAGWFQALGEWESLSAIGRLAWDHPDWCWPEVTPSNGQTDTVMAEDLGHPLIAANQVVTNSVQLGPVGRFLLVTGSNMSGKSTMLRSIGLNVVLAQMGAPVFARRMSLPAVEISTSMRVSDSLADGVSFFMAELNRLKAIVDQAISISQRKGVGHLFLLDEILQGTNSRERQIAVAAVVHRLIDVGSIGAISTHDLELAGADGLASHCDVVHFREHFRGPEGSKKMEFDYQMRAGISPTTNALKLLEMVGLGDVVSGAKRPANG